MLTDQQSKGRSAPYTPGYKSIIALKRSILTKQTRMGHSSKKYWKFGQTSNKDFARIKTGKSNEKLNQSIVTIISCYDTISCRFEPPMHIHYTPLKKLPNTITYLQNPSPSYDPPEMLQQDSWIVDAMFRRHKIPQTAIWLDCSFFGSSSASLDLARKRSVRINFEYSIFILIFSLLRSLYIYFFIYVQ